MNERPPDGAAGPGDPESTVIDPTSQLLGEVASDSRFPWVSVGIAVLSLLWLVSTPRLVLEPMRPAELGWIAEALHPAETSTKVSALAHSLTRATWTWQGVELDPARPLTQGERLAVRLPAAAAGGAALVVFFLLGRLVVGDGAALLAACLLAIAPPWIQAETSAMPLLMGEVMVLLGVTWALALHGRHREVGLAATTALRIGVAGVFLGLGLLLAPATFAAFVTTLLLWFVLGLRRSSSDATTLPVERPRRTVLLAVVGTIVLVGATVLVSVVAEQLAGGTTAVASPLPVLSTLVPDTSVWNDVHRTLLSPGPRTDWLLLGALAVIAVVRILEKSAGRPWKAAGVLPWVYLGAHVLIAHRDETSAAPAASLAAHDPQLAPFRMIVAPLLVLGLGWTVLRGMRPGRARRQEYGFALTWFFMSVLLVPFVPGGHPHDPLLAAAVSLLPPGLLIAGRGTRAMWESEVSLLGRASIAAIAYLPVALFAAERGAGLLHGAASLDIAVDRFRSALPGVVLLLASLGVLAQLLHVRPDAPPPALETERPRGRRGRRGGRRGRRGRRGPPHHS